MAIPLLDLTKEYKSIQKEVNAQIKKCFASQQWILGQTVSNFEQACAGYLGARQAIGVASGTDALLLALTALALKHKGKEFFDADDEIITTPFTFIATAEAIVRAGARPVFVDITPDTYTIDPQAIAAAVTKKTVGIIPVHLYGAACLMNDIMAIARQNKLFVVEDVAQAFGGTYQQKKLGTIGDCGSYSFFPSKNLGGCGDGGLITTNNAQLAKLIRVLRDHGQPKQYQAQYIGFNSRLDAIQAAVLSVKLRYIEQWNRKRRSIAQDYNRLLVEIPQITPPITPEIGSHVYHQYTINVACKRDALARHLNAQGIGARIYYPVSLDKMAAFKTSKVSGPLPVTHSALSHVLSLPMNPFLTLAQLKTIRQQIQTFFGS